MSQTHKAAPKLHPAITQVLEEMLAAASLCRGHSHLEDTAQRGWGYAGKAREGSSKARYILHPKPWPESQTPQGLLGSSTLLYPTVCINGIVYFIFSFQKLLVSAFLLPALMYFSCSRPFRPKGIINIPIITISQFFVMDRPFTLISMDAPTTNSKTWVVSFDSCLGI